MNKFLAAAAAAAIGLISLIASAAFADVNDPPPWSVVRTSQGCKAVLFSGAEFEFFPAWHASNIGYSWTGGCVNGLISGSGTFTSTYTSRADDGRVEHYRVEKKTSAINGLFEGRSDEATYSDQAKPGTMTLHDFGDVRNPMPGFYKNGCSYFVDSSGKVDMSDSIADCVPQTGVAFRDRQVGGAAQPTVAASSSARPASGASAAPTPTSGYAGPSGGFGNGGPPAESDCNALMANAINQALDKTNQSFAAAARIYMAYQVDLYSGRCGNLPQAAKKLQDAVAFLQALGIDHQVRSITVNDPDNGALTPYRLSDYQAEADAAPLVASQPVTQIAAQPVTLASNAGKQVAAISSAGTPLASAPTIMNPTTGRACVTQSGADQQDNSITGAKHLEYYVYFTNTCDRAFSITGEINPVGRLSDAYADLRANSIAKGTDGEPAKSFLVCVDDGEVDACKGWKSWVAK